MLSKRSRVKKKIIMINKSCAFMVFHMNMRNTETLILSLKKRELITVLHVKRLVRSTGDKKQKTCMHLPLMHLNKVMMKSSYSACAVVVHVF